MKNNFRKAYSMIEMSLVVLIMGILFAGAYQGFNIYYETHISGARTLTQNSIISRIGNLAFWYEATFEKDVNDNGKPILMWLDRNNQQLIKSNAYVAQNSDNTKFNYEPNNFADSGGPIFILKGINGLPSLNFKNNSNSSRFLVVDPSLKFGEDDITIFAVLKFKNFNNNAVIFDKVCLKNSGSATSDNSSAINFCKPAISAKVNVLGYPNLYIQNNDGSDIKSTTNTTFALKKDMPYILTFIRSYNQSISLFLNGKLISSTPENLGSINFLPMKIGRTAKDQNVDSEFDLSEFAMIYGKLKNDNKIEIENYLAKKYSIKLER
jgi:prepilin-type N-terminal cleavage/methylation domain-containing protein